MSRAVLVPPDFNPVPSASRTVTLDIATLTGACMRALGTRVAGVMGSSQPLVDQVLRSADATTEPAW
jgi:leucyl aminopeptidase